MSTCTCTQGLHNVSAATVTPILLGGANCRGTEDRLLDCPGANLDRSGELNLNCLQTSLNAPESLDLMCLNPAEAGVTRAVKHVSDLEYELQKSVRTRITQVVIATQ